MARKLSDFELRAALNRDYCAQHGHPPTAPFWLGDAEYLAELAESRRRRESFEAAQAETRIARMKERFEKLRNKPASDA